LQKLDDSDGARSRLRVALHVTPGRAWACEEINQSRLPAVGRRAGLEDLRDQAELSQHARAARRAWGHEGGFAEWAPGLGVSRHEGDLQRDAASEG